MLIARFSDVTSKNQDLRGELDLASVTERIASDSFKFEVPPKVELQLSRNIEGIEVRGEVKANFLQNCGRCLEYKERAENIEVFFLLRKKPKPHLIKHNDNRYEDDIGVYHVDDETVDLSPFLEEQLVLSLSLYWSPEIDSSEKCSLCKKIFSKPEKTETNKTSFKQLLDNAVKNKKIIRDN